MRILVCTPVRLFGDGLVSCLHRRSCVSIVESVSDLLSVRQCETGDVDVILIDVTQGIDLDEVRALATDHPRIAFVALGLEEQRQQVIRCGRAGFVGYVTRSASVDALCDALTDVVAGRLNCSAEISGGLLRALFRNSLPDAQGLKEALTRRETEVLQLIGRGLSNKEIARELTLSVSTVKNHVHHVLEKLQLPGRAQAMRRVRETPWIASAGPF